MNPQWLCKATISRVSQGRVFRITVREPRISSARNSGETVVAGTQPSGRRVRIDEDTSTTLGAAGVVGLGVVVSAFIVAQVVGSDDSATAKETVQAAAKAVPAKVAGKLLFPVLSFCTIWRAGGCTGKA